MFYCWFVAQWFVWPSSQQVAKPFILWPRFVNIVVSIGELGCQFDASFCIWNGWDSTDCGLVLGASMPRCKCWTLLRIQPEPHTITLHIDQQHLPRTSGEFRLFYRGLSLVVEQQTCQPVRILQTMYAFSPLSTWYEVFCRTYAKS